MKKYLPFVFPALALLVVMFLAYRWYQSRTADFTKPPAITEGAQIDELSTQELTRLQNTPPKDLTTVKLEGKGDASGEVRYELRDGKVFLSLTANLPMLASLEEYQVWVSKLTADGTLTGAQKAFVLEDGKSGYMGSASLPEDMLPLMISVKKTSPRDIVGEEILKGSIAK